MVAEQSRKKIIETVGDLFNKHGYAGTSISMVAEATGLRKGSLYNHFDGKEDLALSTLEWTIKRIGNYIENAVNEQSTAEAKYRAVLSTFELLVSEDPPIGGGCPIFNAAVEGDDAHPGLRRKASTALGLLNRFVREIIQEGQRKDEFDESADPAEIASVVVSALEGAIVLSRTRDENRHFQHVKNHLETLLDQLTVE